MNVNLLKMERSKKTVFLFCRYHNKSFKISELFKNEPFSEKDYNQRVQNLLDLNQEEKALEIIKEMKEKNIKKETKTVKSLIKYYIKKDEFSKVVEIAEKVLKRTYKGNEDVYNFLIPYFYEKKEMKIYHSLIVDMKQQEFSTTPRINYFILKNLTENGRKDEVLKFLEDPNFQKNTEVFNIFLQILFEKKEYEKFDQILQEMEKSFIFKDEITYEILLDYYISKSDFQNVQKLYQEYTLNGKRVPRNMNIYLRLFNFYYNRIAFDLFESLFKTLEENSIEINGPIGKILIRYFLEKKHFQRAESILIILKEKNIFISQEIYINFISSLGENGDWDLCVKFIKEFQVILNKQILSILKHYYKEKVYQLE